MKPIELAQWPPLGVDWYYADKSVCIAHGDCREIVPTLRKVQCVVTDPPYCGVIGESWDNQWSDEPAFLAWLMDILRGVGEKIKSNGSIYVFASPQMASRVEVAMRDNFDVLASLIWDKGCGRQGAAGSGVDVTSLRTYWTANTERFIFAGMYGADSDAADAAGYTDACERAKTSVFGNYLQTEIQRSGCTRKEIAALFPSKTGKPTGCVSNWVLGLNVPTPTQYSTIAAYLNSRGGKYLRREYEDLRREYEDLRREYEYLRREYEDLRRPFNLTSRHHWGDIWSIPIERKRMHPTQKPLTLIHQIVDVSTNQGDTILDPFAGSCTTGRAAKDLGRKCVCIEREERYCEIGAERMRQEVFDFGPCTPASPAVE